MHRDYPMSKLRITELAAAALVLTSATSAVQAELPERPDTSAWVCERCPFSDGLAGEVAVGPGYVSGDNADFGNFGGLEEEGAFLALGTDLWYRGADGRYVLVYGDRLGLDSRQLSIEGGRQGLFGLSLDWKEIPWVWSRDTRSPYVGAGTANQSLPAGWVSPGNTADMTLLESSLRPINIGHQREILGLGAELKHPSAWRSRVDFQQITRDGNFVKGASFLFTGTELVAPLDQETRLVEAAVGYVRDQWQLEVAYQVSQFESGDASVRWDNPFPAFNGGDRGELSLAPDNEFHQFVFSGYWRPMRSLNMAGQVAFGRATQDERFLAPTLNQSLSPSPLPVSSLDGKVDTRIANFRVNGHFSDRLRGRLVLRYDERDNATAEHLFGVVATDTFVVGPYRNKPYSYERSSVEAGLDFRVARELTLSASARRQTTDRNLQEVEEATLRAFTLAARATPDERLSLRAQFTREERSNDLDPNLLDPFENPNLRRFHFAEKDRDFLRVAADYAFSERWSAGVFAEFADERYGDTLIGLSEANDRIFGLDVSASLSRHVSASAFIAREFLDAEILGSDGPLSVPWQAITEDEFLTGGFSLDFRELPGRWLAGSLRFTYAQADGDISVEKPGDFSPFPTLKTRRFLFEADVERALTDQLTLALGYVAARAREDDFYRDGVGPATLPNYLSLGRESPDRTVHVIRAMLRYRFH